LISSVKFERGFCVDVGPYTSTPGPLGGPQTNDLVRVMLWATDVLDRLYGILEG